MKKTNIYWLLRCTEYKHAINFVNNGNIRLNTAHYWIEYANQIGEGRGDFLEGVYAATKQIDFLNIHTL